MWPNGKQFALKNSMVVMSVTLQFQDDFLAIEQEYLIVNFSLNFQNEFVSMPLKDILIALAKYNGSIKAEKLACEKHVVIALLQKYSKASKNMITTSINILCH